MSLSKEEGTANLASWFALADPEPCPVYGKRARC
jgi:hypothetical protein